MLSKAKILEFIGGKILDQIIDGSVDGVLDERTKQNLIQEHKRIKEEIADNLFRQNMNESYYEHLDRLISDSRIIDILFNLSYMVSDLSKEERKTYLNFYVENYFQDSSIDRGDLSVIKGKIIQQYDFCFSNVNRPDEKSRKAINQIVLHIANSSNEQKKIINELKCETDDISKILKDIVKMLSVSNLDLENLHESARLSLENLKGRFSREFNVDVELSDWLDKFCNTDVNRENLFKDISELRKAIRNNTLVDNKALLQHVDQEIDKIRRRQEFSYDLLKHEVEKFISDTEKALEKKYEDSKSGYIQSNEYYDWRHLCNINDDLDVYRKAMQSGILVITGEAGVGKSHSIAQFINNTYFLSNKPCIFLLGQHLNENVDPMLMLEKSLHLSYTLQAFLEELNLYALSKNIEVPFVIEGINEGLHSEIWKEYFYGLVESFSRFRKVKLIISIRKTYIQKCLPEGYARKDNLLVIEHKGFENDPLEAVSLFFEYYGISMPTFPILYSDFYNPLFLHTLCRTIRASGIVSIEEYGSFTEVFASYIKVIENVIAQRCNYRENLRLVQKVVNEVVKYSLDNNLQYGIEIDVFYKIVRDVVSVFGICLTDFVQAMIDNGLFYTEMYGYKEEKEYIQFAYERYHNILTAQYILENVNTLEELKESILQGDISNCFAKYRNGIIEELFVQVPQKYKVELLELLPEEQAIEVLEPFLDSLVWRKGVDIETKKARDLLNKYIICREWYFEEMLKKFFIIAPIVEHPFNALALHDYLSKFSMADRDSFWVKIITDELRYNGALTTLVKLGQGQKELYSEETRKLILLLLGWTLACTTNGYREEAIRTMVSLMENELCSVTYLVEKFSNVNDGYIKEGMYSAIYGAVLRSNNLTHSEELGDMIYDDIFDNREVYPNVIVRAHAKGILDYLSYKGVQIKKDLSKIIPPYNSEWYEEIPTDEEVKVYKFDYRKDKITREMYGVNNIIDSMATNTGEKASMYGDFGRYIFEGWVEPWEYYFIPQELSNVVVRIIMEQYGYDYQKHGDFDAQVNYHDRHDHSCERIGKKYQRIASFEMLAKLADNFEPGTVETIYSKSYSEKQQREFDLFLKSLTENLTENDEWLEFEEGHEEDNNEDVKTVFNPYKYEGPWQFDYRGIDPTVLTRKVEKEKNFWENIWNIPEMGANVWASDSSLEPDMKDILFVKYGDDDFVVVEMYNTWKSKEEMLGEKPKEYFLKALAAFVPEDWTFDTNERNIVRDFAEGRNYSESYTIFGREFYWSEAYRYYENLYQEEHEEEKQRGIEFISTGIDYHCPLSYSEKVENVISSYSIPSKYIVDEMKLEQLEDGKWFDSAGKLVAVNITVDGYHAALLINQTAILHIMKNSNQKLVWGIYTEKQEKDIHYETRKAAQWKGEKFEIQQYQEEQWESAKW